MVLEFQRAESQITFPIEKYSMGSLDETVKFLKRGEPEPSLRNAR